MVLKGNIQGKYDSPSKFTENCKIQDTATVEDIDKTFWELCKKENYNKVLEWQYKKGESCRGEKGLVVGPM